MARTRGAMPRLIWAELFIMAVLAGMLIGLLAGRTRAETAAAEAPPALATTTPEPLALYGTDTDTAIDTSGFIMPDAKNNLDLVVWARQAWQHRWGYVWGTFGGVMTEELLSYKVSQYPDGVGEYEDFIRQNWLGRRTVDCIGLIKSYAWYDPDSGDIGYEENGMPDRGTEEIFAAAAEKGPIDTMPELPGLVVYRPGHVGVYIGGGYVIEAHGTEAGVVMTRLSEQPFTHWMKCPHIEYVS